MGKGWFGLSLPRARRRPGPAERTGLVLSGGGSRASFHLGALRYLYEHTDVTPSVMSATSAGAIVASILATESTREGQLARVDDLERVWRGLRQQSDMFAERAWFAKLRSLAPELEAVLQPTAAEGAPVSPGPGAPGRPRRRFRLLNPQPVPRAEDEPGEDQHFHPLLGFGPDPDDVPRSAVSWTPSAMMQVMGALPTLGRAGGDLPSIIRSAERSRAAYRPGPILRSLLDRELFQPERIATSGVGLRLALCCLETGQLRYLRGDGVIVDRADQPVVEEPVDMILGLLASCSIPGVFAPVPLAGQHYVDGGCRENVPIEVCLEALDATQAYVIVCAPPGLSPEEDAAQRNVFEIMARSVTILTDECARDEIAYGRSAGAVVIQPELDVHDSMTVDPGLIAINIDYGWMRAREQLTPGADAEVALHRGVTLARRRAWALENSLLAPADPRRLPLADDERVRIGDELAALKFDLRDLVDGAPDGSLPPGSEAWWSGFERHAYRTPKRAPWAPLTPPTEPPAG